MLVNVAALEQRIEFEPPQLQQFACFLVRQSAGPVAFDRECFKRLLAGIRSLRNIGWQFDRNLHDQSVADSTQATERSTKMVIARLGPAALRKN